MLRVSVAEGKTNHLASMEGVVEQCLGHTTVPPKETVFYAPFSNLTGVEGELVRILLPFLFLISLLHVLPSPAIPCPQVRIEALAYIELWIQPGFAALAKFLEEEYLPATRPSIAASSLGGGFYQACLEFHTSTSLTAQEIHDKGLQVFILIRINHLFIFLFLCAMGF